MHRSILLVEDGKIILRNDSIVNHKNELEKDITNFLIVLSDYKNIIDKKKLIHSLKLTVNDSINESVNILNETINEVLK